MNIKGQQKNCSIALDCTGVPNYTFNVSCACEIMTCMLKLTCFTREDYFDIYMIYK